MKRIYFYLLAILLFIPPLIFFTDLTRNPYLFQIVLLNGGIVLLWMSFLFSGMRDGRLALRRTPLDLPLWSFFLAATLSWLVMLFQNLGHPYIGYSIYSEGLKRWLFLLVNSILAYYAAVHFVNDENRPRFLLLLFWVGELASVYGVLQYFSIEFFWPRVLNPFGGRSVSTFGNPNFLSSYLVLLFPLVYVSYLKAESASKRFFYLFFVVSYFAALLCTLTRSSWLGVFVASLAAAALVALRERHVFANWRRALLFPFGLMLLAALFWPRSNVQGYSPTVIGRLTETAAVESGYYAPWHQRQLIWSCAWTMVSERPVLGKGWGCFELYFPFYQGRHLFLEMYKGFRTHANNSHNEILEIWSQTGTLGFGLYLWFLSAVFGYAWFLIKNTSGEKRFLAIGLTSGLAGMLADNLLNVSLHFAVPGFLFWWNMGLLASLGAAEEKHVRINAPWKKLLLGLVLVLGALLLVRYTRSFLAEVHYFRGFKLSKRNAVQAALPELEAAHRLQRFEVNNNYELANCRARAGSRDHAIEGYREALRANAGYDEIYFNMATVLMQMGNIKEAVDEYTRTLYINPLSLEAYSALGTIFLQDTDRYGKAGRELFKQGAYLFPGNKDLWNNLGYVYTKTGKDAEALEAYRKALEIDPDFETARRNVRFTLNRLGAPDRSFDEQETLMRHVEENIAAKNWTAALSSCERLAALAPRSFKARLYLANIYFTLGRVTDAIREYKAALEREPGNPAALGNLGLAYFENRQYDLARVELQKLLQADPGNQLARQKLDEINAFLARPR
ncbi:MAG: tetratricopeptide repeat protein [Endomicrobiales bacterium]